MQSLARKKMACYVVSEAGLALARQLFTAAHLEDTWHCYVLERIASQEQEQRKNSAQDMQMLPFTSLSKLLAQTFSAYEGHVFFCATGIVVRCIAPHIVHKKQDPAVVVCDEKGLFAISLLSGHWGGGNALATQLATLFESTPVITTASDVQGKPAADMLAKESGCIILDWDKVALCNAALLRDEPVQLYDPMGFLCHASERYFPRVSLEKDAARPRLNKALPAVAVDWRKFPEHEHILRMTVPVLHMGIGCKKGTSKETILEAIASCLQKAHIEEKALACLASVELKKEEQGLVEAAAALGLPLEFYPAETLAAAPSPTPSGMAAQLFGLDGISVSEGAALVSAENGYRTWNKFGSHLYSENLGNYADYAEYWKDKNRAFRGASQELHGDYVTLIVPKMKFLGQVTVAMAIAEQYIPSTVA